MKRKRTDTGEEKYCFSHYDLQGSVTNMVSANVSGVYLAEGNDYDPFGKEESLITKAAGESISNEMKYTGAVEDQPVLTGQGSSGGLYYLSARHYDPNTGRFLQQDTYKGDAHTPWTRNLYAYTGNNPVNYVDPTGHAPHTYVSDGGGRPVKPRATIAAVAGTTIAAAKKTKPEAPAEVRNPYNTGVPYYDPEAENNARFHEVAPAPPGGYEIHDWAYLAVDYATLVFSVVTMNPVPMLVNLMGKASGYTVAGGMNYLATGEWDHEVAWEGAKRGGVEAVATYGLGMMVKSLVSTNVLGTGASASQSAGKGFDSFSSFKKELGSAGDGKAWHHIVEQSQINKSGFSVQQVHNTHNVMAIDSAVHAKISGYYSSIQVDVSGNMKIRDWLAGQSYEFQYQFGINVLNSFGVIK